MIIEEQTLERVKRELYDKIIEEDDYPSGILSQSYRVIEIFELYSISMERRIESYAQEIQNLEERLGENQNWQITENGNWFYCPYIPEQFKKD